MFSLFLVTDDMFCVAAAGPMSAAKLPAPVLLPLCKRLACSDPRLRLKAYLAVKRLLTRSGTNHDSDLCSWTSLLALWKALHYMLWMQDQPLLQEEVVDRLATLLLTIDGSNIIIRWRLVRAFWATQSREWHTLDYWRTDKFLLLVRRVLSTCLQLLSAADWSQQEVILFKEGIVDEVIWSKVKGSLGLRMHVADIFVEELSDVGAPAPVVRDLLNPYVHLLGRLHHEEAEYVTIKRRVFEQLVDQAYYIAERDETPRHRGRNEN